MSASIRRTTPNESAATKEGELVRKAMVRLILQSVYDLFHRAEGIWPTIADLQQELNSCGHSKVDAVRIVQQIDTALLKRLDNINGSPPYLQQLTLTAEAIKRFTKGAEDITNLLAAVRWLGRRMELLQATANQSERGMRFTLHQLAEAIPLDLHSAALRRLAAILQAEGWTHDDHAIQGNQDRVLYADWKVQEFRSVERFSDYRKIKNRLHQGDSIPGVRQSERRMWTSDHLLNIIIAATGVMLVLLAMVSILIALRDIYLTIQFLGLLALLAQLFDQCSQDE